MEILKETWTIKELKDNRKKIDPRPQYQRSLVWDMKRKQLLMDSILRGYDIPKIYLKGSREGDSYQYEITDGQQRINAILDFYDGVYTLPKNTTIAKRNIGGLSYTGLPKDLKKAFDEYEIHVAYINKCQTWELNDLFTRLQKGVSLLPVELRHAMMGEIRDGVQRLLNHKFFAGSKIQDKRFKWQDYLDHALAECYFDEEFDLKAPTLYAFYSELAEEKEKSRDLCSEATRVLNMMHKINTTHPGIFKNKWGFVDVFSVLYKNLTAIKDFEIDEIAFRLNEFENNRKNYVSTSEDLLSEDVKIKHKKDLYNYIQAFTREGAFKNNVQKRFKIMEKILIRLK